MIDPEDILEFEDDEEGHTDDDKGEEGSDIEVEEDHGDGEDEDAFNFIKNIEQSDMVYFKSISKRTRVTHTYYATCQLCLNDQYCLNYA